MDAVIAWVEATPPAYLIFIAAVYTVFGGAAIYVIVLAVGDWIWRAPDLTVDVADTCEDCGAVLDDANRATTCPVHLLCTSCDGDFNPCGGCRAARAEHDEFWETPPDRFLAPPLLAVWDPPAVRRFLDTVWPDERGGAA